MATGRQAGARRAGIALLIAGAAFVVFLANAIVGKVSLLLGASAPVHIGNLAEFALLGLAIVCFVFAILEKEQMQSGSSREQPK